MAFSSLSFLIAGSLAATSATLPAPTPAKPMAEKKICKRSAATESRMGAKRICKTAAQWRQMDSKGEHVQVESTRAGRSGTPGN